MSMQTAYLRYRYAVLDFATVGPVKFGLIDVRDFTDVNKCCEVGHSSGKVVGPSASRSSDFSSTSSEGGEGS